MPTLAIDAMSDSVIFPLHRPEYDKNVSSQDLPCALVCAETTRSAIAPPLRTPQGRSKSYLWLIIKMLRERFIPIQTHMPHTDARYLVHFIGTRAFAVLCGVVQGQIVNGLHSPESSAYLARRYSTGVLPHVVLKAAENFDGLSYPSAAPISQTRIFVS